MRWCEGDNLAERERPTSTLESRTTLREAVPATPVRGEHRSQLRLIVSGGRLWLRGVEKGGR